jgi:hypothetical protein
MWCVVLDAWCVVRSGTWESVAGERTKRLISLTDRLCIRSWSGRAATWWVRNQLRQEWAKPMRCGIRASQTSSAERGELGRTSAVSKRSARKRGECKNRVHAGMLLPQVRQLLVRKQSDVRIRQRFAEALQRWRGHDGVAQPIHAAHKEAAPDGLGGGMGTCHWPDFGFWLPGSGSAIVGQASRLPSGLLAPDPSNAGETPGGAGETPALLFAGFHRRCTQNQLAGSRRTAASNARLTSPMMAAVERGWPFSRVGISLPASIRQRARPTR